jgi:hypothetical protein
MILYGAPIRYRYIMNLSFLVEQIRYTKTLPLRLSLAIYALFIIVLIFSIPLCAFGDGLFQEHFQALLETEKPI